MLFYIYSRSWYLCYPYGYKTQAKTKLPVSNPRGHAGHVKIPQIKASSCNKSCRCTGEGRGT